MELYEKKQTNLEDNEENAEGKMSGSNCETGSKRLCRLCAKTGQMTYIFDSTSGKSLAHKINSCLPITVKKTDPLPKQLCNSCVEQLNIVYEFSESCAQAEDKLSICAEKQLFRSKIIPPATEPDHHNTGPEHDFKNETFPNEDSLSEELADSFDQNMFFSNKLDNMTCPLCVRGSMTIKNKAEPLTMAENQSTFQDPSATVNEINIIIETTKQELPEHQEKFSNTFTFSSGEQCDGNVANLMKPESENNTFEIPVKHVYKCDICVKYFTNEITLQCHHNNFHSGTPICCEICNEYCESPMDYFDHMKKKHARNENASNENICFFICNHCGQQFPDNQLLQEHYKAHQVNCNLCEFCAVNDEMLKVHTILKHSESLAKQSLITCTVCQQVFVHMQQAANHIKCHNVNNQMLQHLDLHVIYNCEYCFTSYAEKSALKIHYNDHNDKMYFCNLCKEKFSNARQVEYHKVIYCGLNQSEIFDVPKMFVCFECDEAFLNVETLSKHNRIHEEMNEMYSRNTFQIEGCNNNKTASVLEDKTNKELNAPPSKQKKKVYMCNVCGDIFTLKNLFDKHFQKHTNECGYFCEICGRNFNHKSGLYTHRRIHTGEKPYPCDLCDKTFRLKHDRDNHRRCHTGERPFKCEYCGKAFRTNHDHRQHLFIHTGQRPYVCNFCGKGFRRINGLNVHRRTHTGEKPYGCDSCGRRFTQKGDMLKHRKTQHALK